MGHTAIRRAVQLVLLAVIMGIWTLVFSSLGLSPRINASVISVRNVWTYPFAKDMVDGVYMEIENSGDQDDSLIRVSTDVAEQATLHQTQIVNNIAHMEPLSEIQLPARSIIQITPGDYHIMLEPLLRDLIEGETIQVTLYFASGKEMEINVKVGIPEGF